MVKSISFEYNERRIQEIKMRPIADDIYRCIFGEDINITRHERDEEIILDIHFAIDIEIELLNGMILTGQEKFLSQEFAKFHSITVEYMNDPDSNTIGDWFKLAPQFYMTGYCTNDYKGFNPWMLLNWPSVVIQTRLGNIKWQYNKNKDGRAKASFKYCDMLSIPNECIIDSSYKRLF